ncbi:FxDxF family PEP-CTERM protein [Bradyrhizobium genosp. P]|uniref:FxDxF family PEP-CTERM protein n=1 Tax=Bradyrhizobium genosp. P TaxID=83641 RepID=UPI003CE7C502
MRNWILSSALATAIMLGSACSSQAAVFVLGAGSYTPGNTPATANFGNSVTGSFTDDFTFSTSIESFLTSASITTTFASAGAQIQNFELALFEVGSAAALDTVTASYVAGAGVGTQQGSLAPIVITPGSYFLEVTGTTVGSTPNASYGGSFAISAAVPEAPTWAMMISGFLALGFLAYRQNGKQIRFRLA